MPHLLCWRAEYLFPTAILHLSFLSIQEDLV
ncbi:hypothetical protein B23_3391 [Geobacillus thermoleovorans B23]|nr:hypothetical protein B23_3391 [Geobacillus thermoleovorans B23]